MSIAGFFKIKKMEKAKKQIDEELLQAEQEELNLLVRNGHNFTIEVPTTSTYGGVLGFFRKRKIIIEKKTFSIKEPTLSTLDRMSELWMSMYIDESKLTGNNSLEEAKLLVAKNAKRMARVIAISVMGEDYFLREHTKRGKLIKRTDDNGLSQLEDLFFHNLKPSTLIQLSSNIIGVCNLGDFIASMRLISCARTTAPIVGRIEKED